MTGRPVLARRALLALAALPLLAAADGGPAAPIAVFGAALIGVMKAGRATPFATRAQSLLPAVQGAFDLPLILQNSVGLGWSGMPAAQQADLLDAFTRFTVATWVANFDSFGGERFVVAPETTAIGKDQVVHTSLVPPQGDPTKLDYVMRQLAQGWRAVDILLDGSISRVAVQRSDFRGVLAGGGPAKLAALLRAKAAALEAGGKS
ncbi:MAG: ABC transporter substrate-binding protein [Rhodospirillales bacterium]|nr:ABC transporter substrate-binding protein [Rhodospirillales bacterium]